MKIITNLLLASLLIGSAAIIGYTNYYEKVAKTSISAPNSLANNGKLLTSATELKNSLDATSRTRKFQINSDIRAREQRYQYLGREKSKSDRHLQSEIRSKLELNLPTASLAVNSENGKVTVVGRVKEISELEQIEKLIREINGVDVDRLEILAQVSPQ